MIVDSSALLAVLLKESDWLTYLRALAKARMRAVSAASYVEAAIVFDARAPDPDVAQRLDGIIERAQIVIEPVTPEQARIARQAYLTFGRGRHPAGLNFGDCFAYALAKATGRPLLYKGGDFAQTDITSAL